MTTTNAPIIIICEDPIIHTDAAPVCPDISCPCHDEQPDGSYITQAREKALAQARRNSAAFLAKIEQETVRTLATNKPRKARHLKVIK